MRSMTGYGRGECTQHGFKITAELSSVNRKQCEINLCIPREFEPLEPRIRDEVNRKIARGRLVIRLVLQSAEGGAYGRVRLNQRLAREYAKEFRKLADDLEISPEISLDLLARAPGVLQADETTADAEAFWPGIQKALNAAIDCLVAMRQREGAALAKELSSRVKNMRASALRIERRAPEVARHYHEQLQERLKKTGLNWTGPEGDRVLQEIALFADRVDISEELVRLRSHFQQYDDARRSTEPVGRILDFLAQEMFREINTIGSKGNDREISREVVFLKAELEKFREQVQNLE